MTKDRDCQYGAGQETCIIHARPWDDTTQRTCWDPTTGTELAAKRATECHRPHTHRVAVDEWECTECGREFTR